MSRSLKNLKDVLNFYRISFAKKNVFYRFSLNKSPHLFDSRKFTNDLWIGDSQIGREILNFSFTTEANGEPLNIAEIFSNENRDDSKYAASFAWIRDLCAIGDNSNLKYVRNLISAFIRGYKKRNKFWLSKSWDNAVVGERIVNWLFSYSFFASGASDRFQREVLSSIAEQFSHLLKCYKAELNPYSRLIALKAIFYGYCVMSTSQTKRVRKILKEICVIVDKNVDKQGMFYNSSPVDHFQVFRSLLEIRFIARNFGIDVPNDVFVDKLSRMAAVVRFLRLSDGSVSQCPGNSSKLNSFFTPSRQMVDTALSIVESKNYNNKPLGFDRLETKKSIVIVNTKPRNARSKFNDFSKPGISIFDFEASFGIDKLLNRADISVVFNGFHIKLDEKTKSFTKGNMKNDRFSFECEAQFFNRFFDFAVRREIELFLDKPQINCADLILASTDMEAYFRFVFNKNVDMREINKKNVLININKSEYVFHAISSDIENIAVQSSQETGYPSIEVFSPVKSQKEIEFSWSLERIDNFESSKRF
ncbi:MAG: hypothetical protein LBM19_03050 [Holosporales bacterium]|jgi:hypothetical protein|nr:hypothetical protein [Holosporales bacterium]